MTEKEQGGTLTSQILKCKSGEFDLESIHTLKLRKLGEFMDTRDAIYSTGK